MGNEENVLNSSRRGMFTVLPTKRCHLVHTASEKIVSRQGSYCVNNTRTKSKERSSREPDFHKKGRWVAMCTFAATHHHNTRYLFQHLNIFSFFVFIFFLFCFWFLVPSVSSSSVSSFKVFLDCFCLFFHKIKGFRRVWVVWLGR